MLGSLFLILIFIFLLLGVFFFFTPSTKQNNQLNQEPYVLVEEEKEQEKPTPPQSIPIQQQISNKLLTVYNSLTSPYQQAGLVFLIGELRDDKLSFENKLTKLDNILNGSLIKWSESDKQELKSLVKQWQAEQEILDKKEWFSEKRWLTDAEIDWAVNQLPKNSKYKILPAYQFNYVRDANRKEADAHLALTELLKEINDPSKELVFIPVNQPNFHWSLLVYETKSKTFEHYDTLNGANYEYAKPLVQELLSHLHQTQELNLDNYLFPYYGVRQNNSYDCGVAVITFIKRIQEQYQGSMEKIKLGEFDFTKDREELRKCYLLVNS